MKTISTLVAVALTALALYQVASAADLTNVPWTSANLATLTSADKTDLLKFLNTQWPGSFSPTDIGQFRWANLQGSGQLYLVMTLSGPCVHFVGIDSRNSAGKLVLVQNIEGLADLKTGIRDLNGDGKDELIVQKPLVEYNCASVVTWPAVYRLENGKYVEASKYFPSYYDDEALPAINSEIDRLEAKDEYLTRKRVLSLTMARDKILRVLGRDPAAGLQQAYKWMNTDNPDLLLAAATTFKDIGGHEQEANAAEASYERALCERQPAMAMCKNAARR